MGHIAQNYITRQLEDGKAVDVTYLDFAKAFDKLDIGITLKKLKAMGIGGQLGQWLQSFLSNRSQKVVVNGVKSSPKPVLSGVPQGSVIGPLLFLILIGDIDTSFISSFADDTRIGHEISSEEDMKALQLDLQAVYQWATNNNMEFNSEKFELIQYRTVKTSGLLSTHYISDIGTDIKQQAHLRDLGITMSSDALFAQHIAEKVTSMKFKIGWVLRTFQTRDKKPMMTLWKSLILCKHDYCCQLWNPHRVGHIQSLELLQHTFIKKIHGMFHKSYWDQLSDLKLYSLQRRRERYIALYTWKILEGLVPNISVVTGINAVWHPRRGRECKVPRVSTKSSERVQNIRRASFVIHGPRIFNSLPKYVRNTSKCDLNTFKSKLDYFPRQVPDQPLIPNYTAQRQCCTNSLIDWSQNAQLKEQLEEPPPSTQARAPEMAVHSGLSQ